MEGNPSLGSGASLLSLYGTRLTSGQGACRCTTALTLHLTLVITLKSLLVQKKRTSAPYPFSSAKPSTPRCIEFRGTHEAAELYEGRSASITSFFSLSRAPPCPFRSTKLHGAWATTQQRRLPLMALLRILASLLPTFTESTTS